MERPGVGSLHGAGESGDEVVDVPVVWLPTERGALPSRRKGPVTLFVVFGALALGAGVAMVLQRNSVHAALLLVLNLLPSRCSS